MTEELTPKQRKVLNFVRKSIQKTGFPPTRTEIAKAFRYSSPNAAQEHLRILDRKGAIELTPSASRGIRLTEEPGLPLIGRVAAGSPILAEEHVERHCQVDPLLFQPRADYLLKVRGHSRRRPARRAPHARGALGPDRGGTGARRGHGEAPAPPRQHG
jgi:repressor LexA